MLMAAKDVIEVQLELSVRLRSADARASWGRRRHTTIQKVQGKENTKKGIENYMYM